MIASWDIVITQKVEENKIAYKASMLLRTKYHHPSIIQGMLAGADNLTIMVRRDRTITQVNWLSRQFET